MEISRRRIAALVLLIVVLSAAILGGTVDLATIRKLREFRPAALAGVLLVLAGGMLFDAQRLIRLSRIAGEPVSLGAALRVVFGNYFMALLTPGAAGGAVIQVLFLRRAGMPTGKATIVVLARTMLSIFFLLCCLPLIFYRDPQILPWFEPAGMVRASTALLGLAVLGMAALRTKLADRLVVVVVKRLPGRWRLQLMKVYRDMRAALAMLGRSPGQVAGAFVESAASLLLLYAMVPLLFLGLGVELSLAQAMGRLIFLNLLLYFAPTPGGAGVAEGLFISCFTSLAPMGAVGIVVVAWRIFAEYLPACIGGYYTVKVFGAKFSPETANRNEGNIP